MDLQAPGQERLGWLHVARAGSTAAPAQRIDDERRAQIAAVGVDDVTVAALDLGRLEPGVAALLPQQPAQDPVVEGREVHGSFQRVVP